MKTRFIFLNLLMIASVLLSLLAWPAAVGPAAAETGATTWYARPGVTGGDCASWGTACDLHQALADAAPGIEIWAMEGIYLPDTAGLADPREATFQLKSGVALYGGFAGTETERGQRDWQAHPSVLSGDLQQNDGPYFSNYSDNSYHVVTGSGTDTTTILDGFTVSAGYAISDPHWSGGGMLNLSGSPTLRGVTFSGNLAESSGGGMFNGNGSSPTLVNVTFSGNWAAFEGGGMCNYASSPTLVSVTFSGNHVDYGIGGGGMCNYASSPTLTNVIFSGNHVVSGIGGGGMFNSASSPTLVNVTFSGNQAGSSGGGMLNNAMSNPMLINVTFSGNSAIFGGAMDNVENTPTLKNSILWGNSNPQILGSADVSYSDIEGGWSGPSTEGHNIAQDPLFVDAASGNLRLLPGSLAIDAGSNAAVPPAITTDLDGKPRIVDFKNTGANNVDMGAYEAQLAPEIIYIDTDAPLSSQDGTSWGRAYRSLQAGLAAANRVHQIWVAEGTYVPGLAGDRAATFRLKSGVALFGGFAGTETERGQRDWQAHPSVLSGDLQRDDGPNFANYSDNSLHVVTASGTDDTAILDGFTISGGNSDGAYPDEHGAGVFIWGAGPALSNLLIISNRSSWCGGGMNIKSNSPRLTNIIFWNNKASEASGGCGGGLHTQEGATPWLTNVTFSGNSAANGSAICNNYSYPILANSIVWGNPGAGLQISGIPDVSYSDIEGGWSGPSSGGHNIAQDPLFVDAANGNLRLLPGSPAIDAGSNAAVPPGITTDLDGKPRIVDMPGVENNGNPQGPFVDLGAYEAQPLRIYLPVISK